MEPAMEVRSQNTMRIMIGASRREEVTKEYIVKNMLFDLMAVKVAEVLAFHDHLTRGYVEVSFVSWDVFNAKYQQLAFKVRTQWKKCEEFLKDVKIRFYKRWSTLIVYTFDAHVEEGDLKTFLSRYCEEMSEGVKLRDEYGMWTGKRRYSVRFRRSQLGDDILPPGSFFLGPYKGLIYVPGRVHACWACGETGHVRSECEAMRCRQCEAMDHWTKDCTQPKRCSLCGKVGHLYRACPARVVSFAEKVKQGRKEEKGGKSASAVEESGARGHVLPAPKMADTMCKENKGLVKKAAGKGRSQDGVQGKQKAEEWGEVSASQEREMVELTGGGLKRPSQDSEGIGTPVRRTRPAGGASDKFCVLQEGGGASEDALLVEVSDEMECEAGADPGGAVSEGEGGPPPKPPEDSGGETLLPGFNKILGAAK